MHFLEFSSSHAAWSSHFSSHVHTRLTHLVYNISSFSFVDPLLLSTLYNTVLLLLHFIFLSYPTSTSHCVRFRIARITRNLLRNLLWPIGPFLLIILLFCFTFLLACLSYGAKIFLFLLLHFRLAGTKKTEIGKEFWMYDILAVLCTFFLPEYNQLNQLLRSVVRECTLSVSIS